MATDVFGQLALGRNQNPYFNTLLQQGLDTSPIQSPWQGASRLAMALLAGLEARDEDQKQNAATKQLMSLPGLPGAAQPDASASAPPIAPSPASMPQASAPASAPSGGGMPAYASAISGIESGGKYDLQGPVTKTGDRAYGRYQVMGANVGPWTKEVLGQEMTPQQFMASPQAQDAVFNAKFGQYAQKYGPEGAARAWFAGPGGMNNPNARDQLGTTVSGYGQKFASLAGIPPQTGVPWTGGGASPAQATGTVGGPVAPQQMAQAAPQLPQQAPQVLPATNAGAPQPMRSPVQIEPAMAARIQSLLSNPLTRSEGLQLYSQFAKPREETRPLTNPQERARYGIQPSDTNAYQVDSKGTVSAINPQPTDIREYEYYKTTLPPGQQPMPFDVWATSKARAGATSIANNIDMAGPQTYDKMAAEALGGRIKPLLDTESTISRQRAINQMQGAVDAIQKRGGTTGGMGQDQLLDLKKTINSAANVLGMQPFSEQDIADKEVLQKINRQLAGAQAKGSVGSRVTNFELSNFLKSNPGLGTSPTFNQRMLGIQSQIEQRNLELGNAINDMNAQAIAKGQRPDPAQALKMIRDYDEQHHIVDPISGQDLTQSYTVSDLQNPETQSGAKSTNQQMEVGHQKNINGVKVQRIR